MYHLRDWDSSRYSDVDPVNLPQVEPVERIRIFVPTGSGRVCLPSMAGGSDTLRPPMQLQRPVKRQTTMYDFGTLATAFPKAA